MSTYCISIVPALSDYPDRKAKASEILNWLIEKNIINASLSNCLLGIEDKGYDIAEGAKNITKYPEDLPFDLITRGLELTTERQLYTTFQYGIDTLICPSCKKDIAGESWDFLNEWAEGESDNLTCPLCTQSAEIHRYHFDPEWGFSNLGFTFWNWPEFTDAFIAEFRQKLGCNINLVFARI